MFVKITCLPNLIQRFRLRSLYQVFLKIFDYLSLKHLLIWQVQHYVNITITYTNVLDLSSILI